MYISKGLFFVLNFTRNEMNEREKRFWVFCPIFDPNTWPFLTTFSSYRKRFTTQKVVVVVIIIIACTFNERNDERDDDSDDDDACERKF